MPFQSYTVAGAVSKVLSVPGDLQRAARYAVYIARRQARSHSSHRALIRLIDCRMDFEELGWRLGTTMRTARLLTRSRHTRSSAWGVNPSK
jgi:hypothetical protein